MPMGFDFAANSAPDINLRQRPMPTMGTLPQQVGYQGGNVRPMPPQPAPTDARPQRVNMPTPNEQAYAHANPNARFMRTDESGNTFADNPAGQRPAPSNDFAQSIRNAMAGGDGAGDDREFRRRQFLAAMASRMGGMQGQTPQTFGDGRMGGFKPWQGAPQPQYQMGQLPLNVQPNVQMPTMNTLPLQQPQQGQFSFDGRSYLNQAAQQYPQLQAMIPSGGFYAGPELSMGTLPLQQSGPQYGGMYDLINQM